MNPYKTNTDTTIFRPILSLALLSLLGACAAPGLLEKAEGVAAAQGSYAKALHAGYLQQARLEINEFDYSDSEHFSIKALAAVDAGDVRPDMLIERHIGKRSRPALVAARSRLMQTKSQLAIELAPQEMAGAQVAFDCWMQEAEENLQPDDIATCREAFELSLAHVGAALVRYEAQAEALDSIAPAASLVSAEQLMAEPGPYLIYFPFASAALTAQSVGALDQAVTAFAGGNNTRIRVAGHADRAGAVIYNEKLSRQRAEAVVAYLVSRGVSASQIQAQWYGEDRPAVATTDGVREPGNRRVEVRAAGQERIAAK